MVVPAFQLSTATRESTEYGVPAQGIPHYPTSREGTRKRFIINTGSLLLEKWALACHRLDSPNPHHEMESWKYCSDTPYEILLRLSVEVGLASVTSQRPNVLALRSTVASH